jgi:hypothetical protein
MGLITPTLPTAGQDRGSEEVDSINALTALLNLVNGGLDDANITANSLTAASLAPDSVGSSEIAAGAVAEAELATAVKPVTILTPYKTVSEANGFVNGGTVSGTYLIGSGAVLDSANGAQNARLLSFLTADFAVSGLTAKFRMRGIAYSNPTSAAASFTLGLYPVAGIGGSPGQMSITLGAVVAGSTVSFGLPATSTATPAVGSDFALPTQGVYAFGVVVGSTTNANSLVGLYSRLEVHHPS